VLDGTDEFTNLELAVRQHARFVFKVAYGVLRNSHDAEDVVQEVFLRAHRKGTEGVQDLPAWLATIAFRLALDRTLSASDPVCKSFVSAPIRISILFLYLCEHFLRK